MGFCARMAKFGEVVLRDQTGGENRLVPPQSLRNGYSADPAGGKIAAIFGLVGAKFLWFGHWIAFTRTHTGTLAYALVVCTCVGYACVAICLILLGARPAPSPEGVVVDDAAKGGKGQA